MPESERSPTEGTIRDEVRLSLDASLIENAAIWAALAQEDKEGGTEMRSAQGGGRRGHGGG